jgi:hypothetical protein
MKSIHPKEKNETERNYRKKDEKENKFGAELQTACVAHMNALEIELSCTKTSPSQS